MGSSSSKAARTAANTAARKYPSRSTTGGGPPPNTTSTPSAASSNQAPNPAQQAGSAPSYGPTTHPATHASNSRDQAVNLDAADPDFAASLRQLGAVQPSPTLSHSSAFDPDSATPQTRDTKRNRTSNPALQTLKARGDLAEEADREFVEAGRTGHTGRRFLDVVTLRQVLMLRDDKGVGEAEIERQFGLKPGVVAKLGGKHGVLTGV